MASIEKPHVFDAPRLIGGMSFAAEDTLWEQLTDAGNGAAFASAWLALQCTRLPGTRAGLVLFEDAASASFAPLALWPASDMDFGRLKPVAEEAINEKRGVVRRDESNEAGGPVRIAYPIAIDHHVSGLVVLEVGQANDRDVQLVLRDLHWGVGWLETQIFRRRSLEDRARLERSGFALDVLAAASEDSAVESAAMATANELAQRLECDRVAIGLVSGAAGHGARLKLAALSNTAWFRRRAALVVSLENAMEEALDQATTVAAPDIVGVPRAIGVAHRAHGDERQAALVSAVLAHRGVPTGVLTFERRNGRRFDRDFVLTAEAVAELLGPLLDLKRRQRRWLTGRLPEALRDGFAAVFGPRRPALKLGVMLAAAAIAALFVIPAPFRVSAKAVLEGAQQRAAVAPFEGFVARAPARAGDVVKRGDVLAALDDKDLRLDQAKWRAEYARLTQEKRKALANFDRAESALVDAQLEQAKAQLDLTNVKLERATVTAPIDGVVISGDWSQKLGAPIEQGAVLFEMSPLESYRVDLKVEEGDVALIHEGQDGTLLLAGRADSSLPLRINRVTSVASVEDGINVFRVEAALPGEPIAIRPGMEGIGKIDLGRKPIGFIWSRRMVDWLRLFAWRNMP